MRADEEYAKEAMQRYLEGLYQDVPIVIKEGGDPPDYVISIGSRNVAFEVTQSGGGFVLGSKGEHVESCEKYHPLLNYFDALEGEARKWVMPGDTISVFLLGQVPDFKKFKREFPELIYAAYQNGRIPKYPSKCEFSVAGANLSVFLTDNYEPISLMFSCDFWFF